MITVYTLTYNEEFILPYFIKHYRDNFPDCKIIIYDNESKDNTVEIAKKNNCEVRTFKTGGKLDSQRHSDIKNSCWKEAETSWVVVCDVDEFLQINYKELPSDKSIIRTEGYNMHNLQKDFYSFDKITHGVRQTNYDKFVMFNKDYINNINYDAGAHNANPQGRISYSNKKYKLLHYHFLDLRAIIAKYNDRVSRYSDNNIKHKMGVHYNKTIKEIEEKYFNTNIVKVI